MSAVPLTIPHPAGGARQQPNPAAYEIRAATWADPQRLTLEVTTKEAGSLLVSEADTPALHAAALVWAATGDNQIADGALPLARAARRAVVDRHYAIALAAGLSHREKVIQIDDASRNNIAGVATHALAVVQAAPNMEWPPEYAAWRCLDNSYLPVTPQQMLELAQATRLRFSALVFRRTALRAAIAAAATVEEVAAVPVGEGWE